jgi:lipopolysaccharide biosynthesis protein
MTVKKWREYCKGVGLDDLYLIAIQSGRKIDPRTLGFDAAAEFPPHGIPTLPKINTQLKFTNPNFTGMVFDYQQIAEQMCNTTPPDYRLFKTVITSWDNTARSQDAPLIFHNSSPQIYQSWLSSAIKYTVENAPAEERIVFINAWNEWAESTYLEPDRKFGYAYLNATAQALLSKNIDIVLHEPILDSPTPQNRRCNTR